MSREWNPRCLKEDSYEPFGTTATGYITPCCYCDTYGHDVSKDPIWNSIFDDELKIENNDSIDNIILSDQWKHFFDAIESGPETAPSVCKRICWRENPIRILS